MILANLGGSSGAQTVTLSVTFGVSFGHFLDNCWNSCGGYFLVILESKVESKSGQLFGKAPGGHLEALWEASWLS